MPLGATEGIGEVHVRINEAGNDKTVGRVNNEIDLSAGKILANCIDTGPSKSDIAFAVHIIGGIDDRSSPDQYRFLRHLASFELPRLLTGHGPTVIVILDGVSTCETRPGGPR
jgi:hypothetical protein